MTDIQVGDLYFSYGYSTAGFWKKDKIGIILSFEKKGLKSKIIEFKVYFPGNVMILSIGEEYFKIGKRIHYEFIKSKHRNS